MGWIHQKAWLSTLDLTSGAETDYELHGANHGVYLFMPEGVVEAAGETLRMRDGRASAGRNVSRGGALRIRTSC